jgi:hypothetical protein
MVRSLLWGWAQGAVVAIARRCATHGALRRKPPHVCRRHPDVAPGRPHVRLANAEGPLIALRRPRAPPRCVSAAAPSSKESRRRGKPLPLQELAESFASPIHVAHAKRPERAASARGPIPCLHAHAGRVVSRRLYQFLLPKFGT